MAIEAKLDSWNDGWPDENYDGKREQKTGTDLEEGLTRMINEPDGAPGAASVVVPSGSPPIGKKGLGAVPPRVYDLTAFSPRQRGEQGLVGSG